MTVKTVESIESELKLVKGFQRLLKSTDISAEDRALLSRALSSHIDALKVEAIHRDRRAALTIERLKRRDASRNRLLEIYKDAHDRVWHQYGFRPTLEMLATELKSDGIELTRQGVHENLTQWANALDGSKATKHKAWRLLREFSKT